jgi:hypothetical protein
MKNKILIILGILLLITLVSAELGILPTFIGTKEIEKVEKDYLIKLVPQTYDSKGSEIVKEIKPKININCDNYNCIYSIYQKGIISSYDNPISRKYCSEVDKQTKKCLSFSTYSEEEMQNLIIDIVNKRIKEIAKVGIERENKVYDKLSNGVINYNEK